MHDFNSFLVLADFNRRGEAELIGAIVGGIGVVLASGVIVYLIRYLQRCRGISEKAVVQMDEQAKLMARSFEHMEIAERHMAAVEKKLDEVIEQLKRRPLP